MGYFEDDEFDLLRGVGGYRKREALEKGIALGLGLGDNKTLIRNTLRFDDLLSFGNDLFREVFAYTDANLSAIEYQFALPLDSSWNVDRLSTADYDIGARYIYTFDLDIFNAAGERTRTEQNVFFSDTEYTRRQAAGNFKLLSKGNSPLDEDSAFRTVFRGVYKNPNQEAFA